MLMAAYFSRSPLPAATTWNNSYMDWEVALEREQNCFPMPLSCDWSSTEGGVRHRDGSETFKPLFSSPCQFLQTNP